MRKLIIPLAFVLVLTFSCERKLEEDDRVMVTSVSIDRSTAELIIGETVQLSATVLPSDATDQSIKWSSSNIEVATISNNGVVTAVSEGRTNIMAKAGGQTSTCIVTVIEKPVPVTSVSLNKESLSLTKGESKTLVATINPVGATVKTRSWTSSDSRVASVSSDGVVTAIANGSATITFKADDKQATCIVTVTVPVESISLNKTELTLNKGQSETLVATVKPDDATESTVSWSSNNLNVATVMSNGQVIAMGGGEATITARIGYIAATCDITVTVPVRSIILSQSSLTLNEGESVTIKATVIPDDAIDKTVSWSSSDESIVTVDQNGKIQAITQGSASIVAQAGNIQATCAVTVIKKVTSVSLDKESLTLLVGETSTLTATVLPEDATDKTVTWKSNDISVATVENGVVKAIDIGQTLIIASANRITATCPITVLIDSASGVYVVYDDKGSISDGMVRPGSSLSLGIDNYSSETIHVTSVQLIDGQTGAIGFEMVLDDEVAPGSTNSWTVTIGDSGIYSPTIRFAYTFKGESYTCETKMVPIPKAPRKNRN